MGNYAVLNRFSYRIFCFSFHSLWCLSAVRRCRRLLFFGWSFFSLVQQIGSRGHTRQMSGGKTEHCISLVLYYFQSNGMHGKRKIQFIWFLCVFICVVVVVVVAVIVVAVVWVPRFTKDEENWLRLIFFSSGFSARNHCAIKQKTNTDTRAQLTTRSRKKIKREK